MYTFFFYDTINSMRLDMHHFIISTCTAWTGKNLWQFITCDERDIKINTLQTTLSCCWFIWNIVFRWARSTLNWHLVPAVKQFSEIFFSLLRTQSLKFIMSISDGNLPKSILVFRVEIKVSFVYRLNANLSNKKVLRTCKWWKNVNQMKHSKRDMTLFDVIKNCTHFRIKHNTQRNDDKIFPIFKMWFIYRPHWKGFALITSHQRCDFFSFILGIMSDRSLSTSLSDVKMFWDVS